MEKHEGKHHFDHLMFSHLMGFPVETKTANYQVTVADTGKLLVGNKSGGAMTFTLPATVADARECIFLFIQKQDQNLLIAAPANSMIAKNNATSDNVTFQTTTEKIGAACMVLCDGTNYFFFNLSGCTDGDGAG